MKFKNKILTKILNEIKNNNIKANNIVTKQYQTKNKVLQMIFKNKSNNINQPSNTFKTNKIDLKKFLHKKHKTIWKKHAKFVNKDVNTFNKNSSHEVDNDFKNWDETMQKRVVGLAMDWGIGSLALPENTITAKGTYIDFLNKFADKLVGDVNNFKYQDKQGLEAFNMALKQTFNKYGI